MAERTTHITGPNGTGFIEHGRKTRTEMIDTYRRHYAIQLEEALTALGALPDELLVETGIGIYTLRRRQVVTE